MYIHKKTTRKISKKAVIFLISIGIVIIVLVTGLVMLLTKGKEVKDTMAPLPFAAAGEYFCVGSNIVYAEQELLTCVDSSLKKVWQCRLYSGGLKFVANDDIIAATGADVVQAVDANGASLFTTRIDGSIDSARVGKDKVAVYVKQPMAEETPAYIVIFDLAGESLYQIDVTDRYILDYGFDSESDELYILEIDVAGAVPVSRISTYRPETQAMTGIKELKDQLVEHVIIIGNDIYAMGTKQLTMYSASNTGSQEMLIYGWVLEDIYEDEEPVFVYVPSDANSDYFDIARIIRASGAEIKINLPPHVFRILHNKEKIYCFANTSIFVYTNDGKYLRTYDMPFEIDHVFKATPGYVFVAQGESIYLLPLP